jgi:trimethylamine--corrinoid protein Co-methyltransferase
MGMRIIDVDTWETRSATLQEHKETMIVGDYLSNVHIGDGYEFYMDLEGVPPVMVMLEGYVSGLRHSSMVEHFGYQKDCEIFAIQVAQELGITLDAELDIASPLTIYGDCVEALFRFAEAGMGVWACSGAHLGTAAPATIAGGVVMQHAESAAFITLAQVVKPGTPVILEPAGMATHPRKGHLLEAPTQFALVQAGLFQIYRKWGVPLCSVHGYVSDSKMFDYQCGYEKALGTLLSALTGSNLHIFQGGNSMELAYSNVLQVLDDDIAGWVGHYIESFDVTSDTMAIDLIKEVGPIPGTFLNKKHTREWWMKERYTPYVSDQDSYAEWIKKGKVDIITRAKERIREILETHKPLSLTDKQEQIISEVMREAREYYRKKGLISDAEWSEYMRTLKSAGYA